MSVRWKKQWRRSCTSRKSAALTESVAYRWLVLCFSTRPGGVGAREMGQVEVLNHSHVVCE